ncbi:MAG TPA: lactonase family protein [Opitutaceae bacterium]|nr:lactonase family protein [Opitutaceae bacterium]
MSRKFFSLLTFLLSMTSAFASPVLVFIGTYTDDSSSQGIYSLRFDPATGTLSEPVLAAAARNPTFLALHPDGRHLYAGGELSPPAAPKTGGVGAYYIDASAGKLSLINQQPTGDGATTHLVVDATGRMVVAVSYSGAYVCALPLKTDGALGERSALIKPAGPLGPNRDRQDQPHAHSVTLSPDNRFAFVCDLGLDRVFSFRLDPAHAALSPNDPPFASVPPGAGPRHSKFSADARYFYVINEMGGSLCVFGYDAARGALSLKQTIPTLPADFHELNTSAEIRIHPNGRFVYASNRGHDSIAVFARDVQTGLLSLVEIVPCGGKHPRNFALSPDGNWLLCANRDTNNVIVFRVDSATGRLTLTKNSATIGKPVCVLFCE